MSYFTTLFKYSIENDLFDKRCFTNYDEEIKKIYDYGFTDIFENGDYVTKDAKVHFYGQYYTEFKEKLVNYKYFLTKPSNIDVAINKDCFIGEYDKIINNCSNNTSHKSNYVNHSVMNTKRLDITFNINGNKEDCVKFIDKCVIPYLSQMIPSTSICEIKYKKW